MISLLAGVRYPTLTNTGSFGLGQLPVRQTGPECLLTVSADENDFFRKSY